MMFRRKELKSKQSGRNGNENGNAEKKASGAQPAPRNQRHPIAIIFMLVCSLIVVGAYYNMSITHLKANTPVSDGHIDTTEERLERRLMQFFDHSALEQAKHASSINKLISLRLSGDLQAGYGNIMSGVFAVIMESFVSNSFPIINNCIILSMFQHPILQLSFLKNGDHDDENGICQFDEHQLAKYSPNPNVQQQKQVNNQAVGTDLKKHGIIKTYASMLEMNGEYPRLYDIVSSAAAKWMMQRPTPSFQSLVDERKAQILSQCGTNKIHFGIQIRTWRDFQYSRSVSFEAIHDNINACIRGWLDRAGTHGGVANSTDKICVYVTSDDPEEMKSVVKNLEVDNERITFVIGQPPLQDSWHTKDSFATHKSNFNPKDLPKHEELIDWMVFGEADAAIYTLGSTFGRTARMRRGYPGQKYDYIVGRSNVNKPFLCHSVQPSDFSLMEWTGPGSLNFKDRIKNSGRM